MDIFSSIGLGGLTGLIGPIITAFVNYKMKKVDIEDKNNERKFKIELLNAESKNMIEEAKIGLQVEQARVEGEIEKIEAEAYRDSLVSAEKPLFKESYMQLLSKTKYFSWMVAVIAFMFGLIDWLKGLARPIITYYLIGCSTYITILSYSIVIKTNGGLDPQMAQGLFHDVCIAIIYMTVSCVMWWFSDRRMAKFINGQIRKVDPKIDAPF